VDIKSIAKHLGMASGENATPIRIVHNSAGHLLGPARSIGGVLIGKFTRVSLTGRTLYPVYCQLTGLNGRITLFPMTPLSDSETKKEKSIQI